ncbi:MAG: DUF305 domain-containing protein [Frankiaceae bacterium]|nr:DUF305 domain-containing protein [Frankiaceae bacterium]
MNKRHLTASALLASALVLTACGSDAGDTAGSTSSGSNGGSTASETATGNDADVAFLTGMTPHHEQAVEMSEMVLAADPPAEVAAIAQQIKDAQDPEIEQMKTMLADLGQDTGGAAHSGGHSAGMAGHGGMMDDDEMAALMDASGEDAARLYLEGMIRHHEGAIEASDTQIADGQYAPAVDLAKTIKTAQAAEVTEMQALLQSL